MLDNRKPTADVICVLMPGPITWFIDAIAASPTGFEIELDGGSTQNIVLDLEVYGWVEAIPGRTNGWRITKSGLAAIKASRRLTHKDGTGAVALVEKEEVAK